MLLQNALKYKIWVAEHGKICLSHQRWTESTSWK